MKQLLFLQRLIGWRAAAALLVLAIFVISSGGCDKWFTVPISLDMQQKLGLPKAEVSSDKYPALRAEYDAIKKADAVQAVADTQAKVKAETAEAAKTAQLEAEVVSKANRELALKIADAKRKHDGTVREADATLDNDLAALGATNSQIVNDALFRNSQSQLLHQGAIDTIVAAGQAAVKSIESTRVSAIGFGDASFAVAKDRQAETLDLAKGAGGIVMPLLAGLGGAGTIGASLLALFVNRSKKQALSAADDQVASANRDAVDAQAQADQHKADADAKAERLQLVTDSLRSLLTAGKLAGVMPAIDQHLHNIAETPEVGVIATIRASDGIDTKPATTSVAA